ncbi:DUF6243 family protein [Streptomyces sp. NBC_01217]|uniref:DUF6243 family protein n=1 Tax=Streptomyces sp. NBC_01217 TaxID=2903779 RepID=UPI002E0DF199|nr:DUF6243 family protein [Streptomyces sp. NBC_01217]
MAKSRNNLLGVGGQRKKLSRAEQQGAGPARDADRRTAAEKKQELLRKMRERAQSGPAAAQAEPSPADSADGSAEPGPSGQDAPARS